MTTMSSGKKDDPHDDATHWIGCLSKQNTDSTKCIDKRDLRRQQQSNVQRQKLSMEKGWKNKLSIFNRCTNR